MEKITNEDLKEMLMKSENKEASDVVVNDETGEVQWVKVENVENLEDSLEQDIDFNTIPEKVEATPYELSSLNPILEHRKDYNLGITEKDLKDMNKYVAGEAARPEFLEKYVANIEGKIRDQALLVSLIQTNQVSMMLAYRENLFERLFIPENLYSMDASELASTLSYLDRSISTINKSSLETVEKINQSVGINSKYRDIVDKMLLLPKDKLEKLQEILKDENVN